MTDDPYLTEKIEKLDDEVKEQKLKFNDMLRERNRYIDEVKELKAEYQTKHNWFVNEIGNRDQTITELKESLKQKPKMICPIMSQTTVTACRKDCSAYNTSFNPPCAIMAAHYATAQEWSYKE